MSTFNRGLTDEFVCALNKEYDNGGWWRTFMKDEDIFLAIRENYVNAYYRGCSLLRLSLEGDAIVGQIHYKYLLRPSMSNEYVRFSSGKLELDDAGTKFLTTVSEVDSLDSLKRAATPYASAEKKGVHNILKANGNGNILDVEIAFGKDEADSGAPRLDFAALQASGDSGDVKVVFFEAKRFNNDALRKSGSTKPGVVEQIETYRRKLCANRAAIVKSYSRVCCNLRSLHGVAERHPERHAILESIASGQRNLDIDPNPVLIVFDFDGDQKDGKHWKPHREKLIKRLGKGRVHLKGNSAEFKLSSVLPLPESLSGIST